MNLPVILVAVILILVVLLLLGVPLPFCFGGAIMFMNVFADVSMAGMMMWAFNQMINLTLLSCPLFIYAGTLLSYSGVASALLDFVDIFVGKIKGGLGVVSVVACAIIGAISGSGFTGVAATGPIMIPRMVEKGYPRGYATALVTVSSILGLLIPPSVIMIMFGWITQTSILACFLSTVGPGILITILFSIINVVWVRIMPSITEGNMSLTKELPVEVDLGQDKIMSRLIKAIPALSVPVIILGGIYGGTFTPTEAAAVAAAVTIPIGAWFYKGLTVRSFLRSTRETAVSVGAIMTMMTFTLILSQTLVMLRAPQLFVDLVFRVTDNYFLILFISTLYCL